MKIVGIIAIAATLLAGVALAQGPMGGGFPPGDHPRGEVMFHGSGGGPGGGGGFSPENLMAFRMMIRGLDLSDEQADEIEYILAGAREDIEALRSEMTPPEEHTPFIELFTSPTLTVRDLEDALGVMDEAREAMRGIMFQAIVDLHDVLTAEQLEDISERMAEHGMGRGMDHGTHR